MEDVGTVVELEDAEVDGAELVDVDRVAVGRFHDAGGRAINVRRELSAGERGGRVTKNLPR